MNIEIISNTKQHAKYLEEARKLVRKDPSPNSPEGKRLKLLALVIEDYERRTTNFDLPSPVEAIEFYMEQKGLSRKDLIPFIGSRFRVSEILSGKRNLTLPMIRRLHKGLGIPTDLLVGDEDEEPEKVQRRA